jgi:hypothetical protein
MIRAGSTIFWLATAFAAAIILWVASDFLYGLGQDFPVVNLPGVILAAAIWAVGWLCRFAL